MINEKLQKLYNERQQYLDYVPKKRFGLWWSPCCSVPSFSEKRAIAHMEQYGLYTSGRTLLGLVEGNIELETENQRLRADIETIRKENDKALASFGYD